MIRIEEGQVLLDIAMQEMGDVERLFELAELNGLSITERVEPGTMLSVGEPDIDRRLVCDVLRLPSNKPASDEGTEEFLGEGIEFWALEYDFIIQ